uniref:Dolichol-phosphate mannosyltransferase subunit 3 n=1 Tax=Phlebotomus kandelakii TaxID=1109342 RepID=A0A6B2E767_9DIPT
MTKLMQWLTGLVAFLAIYIPLVTGTVDIQCLRNFQYEIKILPIVLIGLFGIHSVNTVLYRTFTIRDCNEAAEELQNDIKEARKDLISKGFKFRD